MFSNFYHLGNSIELFNLQNKNLCSKWHFEGKYSKVFDPSLKCYEMILSTGNLSKMLIPKAKKNSKIKTLSIFQGYVVFQLYLFTSKQFSIELAISDTTNAKRRLIFSSNNDNLVLNQLHCRIPIFELPIGKWVNLSIDILSFVSECFKNLTFRSVDYISLSMSGKVRYIFTMRTPIIDNTVQLETEEKNDAELDDCGNKISDNSGNSSFIYGAKDIPDKYKFPEGEIGININMNCNYVLQQITIQNQIKQLNYQQRMIRNNDPILVQDTADASNMDKGLRVRHRIYVQNKKNRIKSNKFLFDESYFESPFNNYNNVDYENDYNYLLDLQNNPNYYENNFNNYNYNYSNNYNNMNYKNHFRKGQLSDGALEYQTEEDFINYKNTMDKNAKSQNMVNSERLKNIGNIIVSQSQDNHINSNNKFMSYNNSENYKINNEEMNKGLIHYKEEGFKNNRYDQYNLLKNSENSNSNSNNTNSESGKNRFIFFNKDEYNKAYNSGKGLTDQINNNLHINLKESNSNTNRKSGNTNENDDKNNYQLSTIKNENVNSNNTEEIVEEEKKNFIGQMSEDSLNIINNLQNKEFTTNERLNEKNQNNNEGENLDERQKNENDEN
jgi:hypothetical protein